MVKTNLTKQKNHQGYARNHLKSLSSIAYFQKPFELYKNKKFKILQKIK